jgi:hypothetical protein
MNTTAITACQMKDTSRRNAATTFLLFIMAWRSKELRRPTAQYSCLESAGP